MVWLQQIKIKIMKYFERLKYHPGLQLATLVTILAIPAGAMNKSLTIWHGAVFGLCCSAIVWIIVLLSNIKK